MVCQDVEDALNLLLDGDVIAFAPLESEIEAHVAGCSTCRERMRRYQTLRQVIALASKVGRPEPSPSVLATTLSKLEQDRGRSRRVAFRSRILVPLSIAASLLLAAWVVQDRNAPRTEVPTQDLTEASSSAGTGRVDSDNVFSIAHAVTLDFAVEKSTTVARAGREWIERAIQQEEETIQDETGGLLAFQIPRTLLSDQLLQSVGERLSDQMTPFSGTARQAFGFLIVPVQEDMNRNDHTNGS